MIEYKTVSIHGAMIGGTEAFWTKEFDKLGEDGWILCHRAMSGICVFYRIKNEEEEV